MDSINKYPKPAKGLVLIMLVSAGFLVLYTSQDFRDPEVNKNVSGVTESIKERPPRINISSDYNFISLKELPEPALRIFEHRKTDPSHLFGLYALKKNSNWNTDYLPVDGTYSIDESSIRFKPRYELMPGINYYVRFNFGQTIIDTSFTIEPPHAEAISVEEVYPTADILPQNLLKFYITFSGSMSRGGVYKHIKILDEQDNTVPNVFLEISQELWDPDTKRLTLLFEPGRIKRGLTLNRNEGSPLKKGQTYTLIIKKTMPDGNGQSLARDFRKTFTITEADRERPDPDNWLIDPPRQNSMQSLELVFNEPMDYALTQRVISVRHNDNYVPGKVEVGQDQKTWRFIPATRWNSGTYELEIETILEDLAGNNLKSVFDVDLSAAQNQPISDEKIIKVFTIPDSGT